MRVLAVNGGSSSLKFAVWTVGAGEAEREEVEGAVERIGLGGGHLWLRGADGGMLADALNDFESHDAAAKALFESLADHDVAPPDAIGHRLVHGGPDHDTPQRVTPSLLDVLRGLVPLAPLHLPSEIKAIEAMQAHFPDVPEVACFDTSFHRHMPDVAQRLPIPRRYWHEGVRRYGFHGLSYEWVLSTLGEGGGGRLVMAHLGNGASMAAVKHGRPMDTTMGLTPTGGLMMGTRCGDLDPGVVFHLMEEKGFRPPEVRRLLEQHSGLEGVSGISRDMRTLLERRGEEGAADEAVELFCYLARKHVGALAAVLGGLDTLVFTGGIGEHAAPVRSEICEGLGYLGVRLDEARNARHAEVISRDDAACTVRVVPTNEDLMIARHTARIVEG